MSTLSTLKHQNIVQYKCAWQESPLKRCQEELEENLGVRESRASVKKCNFFGDDEDNTMKMKIEEEETISMFYIAMELCKPETLADRLSLENPYLHTLSQNEAFRIFDQIVDGMIYVHEVKKLVGYINLRSTIVIHGVHLLFFHRYIEIWNRPIYSFQ